MKGNLIKNQRKEIRLLLGDERYKQFENVIKKKPIYELIFDFTNYKELCKILLYLLIYNEENHNRILDRIVKISKVKNDGKQNKRKISR